MEKDTRQYAVCTHCGPGGMADHYLNQVAAAAGARTYAERSYREAIVEAARSHSQADIARAAGVTKQAISAMLKRVLV